MGVNYYGKKFYNIGPWAEFLYVGVVVFMACLYCALRPKQASLMLKTWPGQTSRSQCYKTLIYCHCTVTPPFCVIKQCYDGNYRGMAVSNTTVVYHGISTLEITGIFITLAVNYGSI
jgi:hypothetical protein